MGKFSDIYKRCKELGDVQPESCLPTSLIKLGEETGELNEAYLRSIGYKKGKDTDALSDMQEECVDSLIMVLDIANKLKISKPQLYKLLDKKLDKWESKYTKK